MTHTGRMMEPLTRFVVEDYQQIDKNTGLPCMVPLTFTAKSNVDLWLEITADGTPTLVKAVWTEVKKDAMGRNQLDNRGGIQYETRTARYPWSRVLEIS